MLTITQMEQVEILSWKMIMEVFIRCINQLQLHLLAHSLKKEFTNRQPQFLSQELFNIIQMEMVEIVTYAKILVD